MPSLTRVCCEHDAPDTEDVVCSDLREDMSVGTSPSLVVGTSSDLIVDEWCISVRGGVLTEVDETELFDWWIEMSGEMKLFDWLTEM